MPDIHHTFDSYTLDTHPLLCMLGMMDNLESDTQDTHPLLCMLGMMDNLGSDTQDIHHISGSYMPAIHSLPCMWDTHGRLRRFRIWGNCLSQIAYMPCWNRLNMME